MKKESLDIFKSGITQDGTYMIYPNGSEGIQVYCEMSKDGWTRIMNRIENGLAFNQNWSKYQIGFGDISSNHGLGFNSINKILSTGDFKVRFEFKNSTHDYFELDRQCRLVFRKLSLLLLNMQSELF